MGKSGSKQNDTSSRELVEPWRKFDWGQKAVLKTRLQNFTPSYPDVKHIRIVVAGQIAAGKSSFINSVSSAFQGEIVCEALADNSDSAASHSFTKRLKVYRIRNGDADLPFEICDVMGLDPQNLSGCQTDDIIKTVYGQVREGYKFSKKHISDKDEHYTKNPSLTDQAFCLVYVIDANNVQFCNVLIEKLRVIRQEISDKDIPQVIVMTKVDEACPIVKHNLRKVYYSKNIKEKMELCSLNVGVPMCNIFPVKNYHDETDANDDVDVLILKALDQIVRFANGRLRKELLEPWRKFDWGQKAVLKTRLQNFTPSYPDVKHIRIVVAGQIAAGKSSFINSVSSAFQGEIVCEALADNSDSAASHSFTKRLKVYRIRNGDADLPFEICDVMGLQVKNSPESKHLGQTDDIIKTVYGHVREGYKFSEKHISDKDEHYTKNPSLTDQAFCLVYIIDANKVQLCNVLIEKLKVIRQEISDKDIPQVIVMTKVDEACPIVKHNLRKVYYSKNIKEKMELCSLNVGVPMCNIFPVKNYHDETDANDDVDVLMLKALDQIVRFANGRLRKGAFNL